MEEAGNRSEGVTDVPPVLVIRLKIADAGAETHCEALFDDFRGPVLHASRFRVTTTVSVTG